MKKINNSMKIILLLALCLSLNACNGLFKDLKEEQTEQAIDPKTCDSIQHVIKEFSFPEKDSTANYFYYFGFRDWYRWPLVYPYSLNSVDIKDNGFICDESKAKDITSSQDGIDQISLGDIKRFSFNKEILIAETGDEHPNTYKLFNFKNKKISSFNSLKDLQNESLKYGQLISDTLVTLEDYGLFFN